VDLDIRAIDPSANRSWRSDMQLRSLAAVQAQQRSRREVGHASVVTEPQACSHRALPSCTRRSRHPVHTRERELESTLFDAALEAGPRHPAIEGLLPSNDGVLLLRDLEESRPVLVQVPFPLRMRRKMAHGHRPGEGRGEGRRDYPPAMTMLEVPTAIHRGDDELPWVDIGEGSLLKVLQIKEREGLWVIRNRFQPGYRVQTHKHTGPVYAFTTSGAWKYKESDFVNRAGSFLYEPAGSVHTLVVPDDNTEPTDVFFAIWGANLNLDADGKVESIVDAGGILQAYYMLCEAEGLPKPDVVLD
jgi:2,4'-dihydroxyacetophenone dioxygenase